MNLNPAFGFPQPALIAEFELYLDAILLRDYRSFLEQSNGGHPKTNCCRLLAPSTIVRVDVLFGLGLKRDFNLEYWQKEYRDELPDKHVIIGSDSCGNFFVLNLNSLSPSVFLWDHLRLFGCSSDDINAYRVATTFTEFSETLFQEDQELVRQIVGPLGSKLLENIWHRSGTKLQEINRVHYTEFAHVEGFCFAANWRNRGSP